MIKSNFDGWKLTRVTMKLVVRAPNGEVTMNMYIVTGSEDKNEDKDKFWEPGNKAFNIERGPTFEEVLNCEHQEDWKEEWLLDAVLPLI